MHVEVGIYTVFEYFYNGDYTWFYLFHIYPDFQISYSIQWIITM